MADLPSLADLLEAHLVPRLLLSHDELTARARPLVQYRRSGVPRTTETLPWDEWLALVRIAASQERPGP